MSRTHQTTTVIKRDGMQMEPAIDESPGWARRLPVDLLLLALLYVAAGRLSLLFDAGQYAVSPLWLPAGVGLAALFIAGWRGLLVIVVGSLANGILAELVRSGGDVSGLSVVALRLALTAPLGPVVAWFILGRPRLASGWRIGLGDLPMIFIAVAVAGAVAAALGLLALSWQMGMPGEIDIGQLIAWAAGDSYGMLLGLPLLLHWWCLPLQTKWPRGCGWLLLTFTGCAGASLLGLLPWVVALPLLFATVVVAVYCRALVTAWSLLLGTVAILSWSYVAQATGAVGLQPLLLAYLIMPLTWILARWRQPQLFRSRSDDAVYSLFGHVSGSHSGALASACICALLGIVVTFVVWHGMTADMARRALEARQRGASNLCDHLAAQLDDLVETVSRMAKRWDDHGGLDQALWRADARRYVADAGCLQALEWVDGETVVRWVEPVTGNEAVIGLQLSDEPRRRAALERSLATLEPAITPVVMLKQGGAGFVMYMPLQTAQPRGGFMVAVFRLGDLLEGMRLGQHAWDAGRYAIDVLQDEKTVLTTRPEDLPLAIGGGVVIDRLGKPLEIRLTDLPGQHIDDGLARLVLNSGLLLSTLLGLSVALVGIAMRQTREAQLAGEAKARFLATMSHEIRTPMNGLLGGIDLALHGMEAGPAREQLELAKESGVSLLTLINDILDFSKFEAGKLQLERIPCRADSLAEKCVALFRGQAEQRGLELRCQVESCARPMLGDPLRLRQIMLNLLSNAVKFTEQGSVVLSLQCSSVEGEETSRLQISCEDTGVGMSAAVIDQLFKPFHQADSSTTRRFGGTGLGMAIVYHLVEAMGGTVTCASTVGKGTCIDISLPIDWAEAPADGRRITPAEAQERIAAIQTRSPEGLRVLVADDSLANQRIMGWMLGKMGCLVAQVEDGRAAVDHCRAQAVDLVFMDMAMPVLDGIAATRELRLVGKRMPIIALTANVSAEDRARCTEAGMNGFLTKPVSIEQLRAAIANAPEQVEL